MEHIARYVTHPFSARQFRTGTISSPVTIRSTRRRTRSKRPSVSSAHLPNLAVARSRRQGPLRGHEDAFPAVRLNGRCRIRKRSIAAHD